MLNELLIKELSNKVDTNTSDIQNIKDSEVYSTNEVKTNKVWIDGKPLYRKIVEHIVGQSWKDVEGISNIEHCFSVRGYFEQNQDEEFIIPYTSSGTPTIGLWFSVSKTTHKLRQATNQQDFYNKKAILIVEYTKTTD